MGLSRVFGARRRLSAVAASLTVAFAVTSLMSTPAEARKRHYYKRHASAGSYAPAFSSLVVDANSGRVLQAQNPDELRHPASVTKVMTLYLLFEQLEKGRYRLDSPLRVSSHAASMAPSKLGLEAGETIEVEDAIKALVTKSANDVAATVAENIGGDEDTFAEMMTRKARALGMSRTVYKNASGLPNPQQVTTARDLALLGRAIQDRFPRYYKYFGTPNFYYAGSVYRNHNRLLGRIEGIDGIKTGYTRASGFNLLTSARRDGRHIIAVVLGGKTARVRDNIMASLVETQIARAATGRTATMVAEANVEDAAPAPRRAVAFADTEAMRPDPAREIVRDIAREPTRERPRPPAPIQTASTTPMAAAVLAASQSVKARPAVVSAPVREDETVTTASVSGATRVIGAQKPVVASATTPSPLRWVAGPAGRPPANIGSTTPAPKLARVETRPEPPKPIRAAEKTDKVEKAEKAEKTARGKTEKADKAEKAGKSEVARKDAKEQAPVRSGTMIQIGATDDIAKANALIARARAESRSKLASAQSYTEKVQKGDSTLYRARFAGLETSTAEAACRELKRSGFACFTTKN